LVALGRGSNWDLWNEANNLYWGTIYGTTSPTAVPAWPSPVVMATWLTDSTIVRILLLAGMGAWVVGWTMTLFLGATRVLLAAANDRLLPARVARTTGDTVPGTALALLVVPACGIAALDAYWDSFADWAASAVLALALTTVASSVTALLAFRRHAGRVAVAAALFALIVTLVVGVWVLDPVFGLRTVGSLVFVAALYLGVAAYTWARNRQVGAKTFACHDPQHDLSRP
jgi:amino acid transporter